MLVFTATSVVSSAGVRERTSGDAAAGVWFVLCFGTRGRCRACARDGLTPPGPRGLTAAGGPCPMADQTHGMLAADIERRYDKAQVN